MLDQLTPKELEWALKIKAGEDQLDTLKDKKEKEITERFIKFLDLILKYGNLKDVENFQVCTRLGRIHRSVSWKELDHAGYDYVIFNGLYLPLEVAFIEEGICNRFFSCPNESNRIALGIPDNLAFHTMKYVKVGDKRYGVCLTKSDMYERYIGFNTKWSYPNW